MYPVAERRFVLHEEAWLNHLFSARHISLYLPISPGVLTPQWDNSKQANIVLPPQLHRSIRLAAYVRSGFIRRQEPWHTHIHAQKRGQSTSQREALDSRLLIVPQCTKLDVWKESVLQQQSKNKLKIKVLGLHCSGRLWLGRSISHSYLPAVATLKHQCTRHRPPPGSNLQPCVHAGLLRAPRPKALEQTQVRKNNNDDVQTKSV